jgi:enamine deaminase RidA (YjgF/YER057c/UK114 family)
MNPEERVLAIKLEIPPIPRPAGLYKPLVVVGDLAYVSGHGPWKSDGTLIVGRAGAELDVQRAKQAARQAGLAILATLRAELRSLNRVSRVIKVLGLVNCTADFYDHPAVLDGCSELFAEVFGQQDGVGARSAVGVSSLPKNIAVEIEAIFEIL